MNKDARKFITKEPEKLSAKKFNRSGY